MKIIVLLSFSLVSLYASAQNIKLDVGKTFKVTSSVEISGVAMGIESSRNINSISTIKVNSIEKDLYKGSNTVTSLKMTGNAMGQDLNYDSDKKDDENSEIGKMMGGNVKKSSELTIDKNTGDIKEIEVEKDENKDMMGMLTGGAKVNPKLFFIEAKTKKLGDKWSDSTNSEGIKIVNNYEITIVNGNTITISTTGSLKGTTSNDMGGQSMEITTDTKLTGNIVIDSNTGAIKRMVNNAESTNSLEVGGRTIEATSTTKFSTIIE